MFPCDDWSCPIVSFTVVVVVVNTSSSNTRILSLNPIFTTTLQKNNKSEQPLCLIVYLYLGISFISVRWIFQCFPQVGFSLGSGGLLDAMLCVFAPTEIDLSHSDTSSQTGLVGFFQNRVCKFGTCRINLNMEFGVMGHLKGQYNNLGNTTFCIFLPRV